MVKHNGPVLPRNEGMTALPAAIAEYVAEHDLELTSHAGPEAQVAALADDIAYNNHDIDDGLRAGLFTVDDLIELPLVGEIFRKLRRTYPDLETSRLAHEGVRRLINVMVEDLLTETRQRLADANPRDVRDIRGLGRPVVAFSAPMDATQKTVKAFLFARMYRHSRVVPDDRRRQACCLRSVRALYGRAWLPAGRVACAGRGCRSSAPGAPCRGLYRRDDGSLCVE